ncbi:uncharacterized protein BX664DRAFT_338246 [Halteromyces radiatus]|uniref:uncharacterized protein n=1 Tax=Halteromyces radiatus TaxID=101107 RepID=UPI00221F1EF5|nr:uncharacterized protein BX664DRAFT_338246 [Halteromyces radiatus]KAI8084978.1 hypothetical protein BX664DRAFT_338246 [Halteromyces radiatus]
MKHHRILFACVLPFLLPTTIFAEKTSQEHLTEGNAYLKSGKLHDAVISYDAAISQDPDSYMSYYRRATVYLSLGRNQAAVDDFTKILTLKPDFDRALYQRARIYAQDGEFDLAKKDLENYMKHHADDGAALDTLKAINQAEQNMEKAQSALDSQSYEQCIEHITEAIRTAPNMGRLRRVSAKCHYGKHDIEAAAGDLARAAHITPSDPALLIELANINFYLLNEPEGALANLKQCLHYDPEQKQCKTVFRQLKKLNKTIKSIQDNMEKKKYSTASNQLIGTASRQGIMNEVKDHVKQMETQYLSSLSTEVDNNIPQRLLLQCYETACRLQKLLNKEDTKIIDWCTKTLSLQDDHVDALMYRGEVYLNQHEYEKAMQDLQKANDVAQGQNHQVRQLLQKAQQLLRQSKRKDYYKILGVPRDADTRQIKKAYRQLAYENHPDRAEPEKKQEAERQMAEINAAYEVLSNDEMRQQFDNGFDPFDPEQQNGGGGGGFHPHGGNPFAHFQGFPFGGGFPGGAGDGSFEFKMHF